MRNQKAQIIKLMSVFIGALLIVFILSPALANTVSKKGESSQNSVQTLNQHSLESNSENIENYANYVLCKSGKLVRTLRVTKEGDSFVTQYAKEGQSQIVGRAKNEKVCVEILNKVKSTLESGNWSCKDISSSQVSEPSSEVQKQ